MLLYKNTFENTKTIGFNFPIEDQFYADENRAIVADGITRDPIGMSDFSKFSEKELAKNYPRPSGAELAATKIVQEFSKNKKKNLKDVLIDCNKKVKELNEEYNIVCDYLENDYYGAVASCIEIRNNILKYSFICDCGVIVYTKEGKIKFQTLDEMDAFSQPYMNKIGIPWYQPECRYITRKEFRNNPDKIIDGKHVSYGALTGEEIASKYIREGEVLLDSDDYCIVYSDGFSKFLKEPDFIERIINFNKTDFEKYIEKKSLDDYEIFGKEKTIVIYKYE